MPIDPAYLLVFGTRTFSDWHWAERVRKCPHQPFPPEFEKHGTPAAFHARNREMVEFVAAKPDGFAVCFWDGVSPGTKSTIGLCGKHHVPLKKVLY